METILKLHVWRKQYWNYTSVDATYVLYQKISHKKIVQSDELAAFLYSAFVEIQCGMLRLILIKIFPKPISFVIKVLSKTVEEFGWQFLWER